MVSYTKPAAKVRDSVKPLGIVTAAVSAQPIPMQSGSVFAPEDKPEEKESNEEKIVLFKFSASEKLQKKFDRAKELLWHQCPSGKFEGAPQACGRLAS